MKTEGYVGHHEAREALVLSVASVTAIMLTAYLLLLILYWACSKQQSRRRSSTPDGFAFVPQYVPCSRTAFVGLSNLGSEVMR
jgi:hypothetical protein